MQRTIIQMAALALLAFVALSAVAATCTWTPSPDSGSQASPPEAQPSDVPVDYPLPGPTFPWKSSLDAAEDVGDALSFARERIMAKPPFVVTEPERVVYVEATVGDARDLLDPNRETKNWDVPVDVPAVVVVAYGRFQFRSVPSSSTPGPTYNALWVVVPLGQPGTYEISTDDQHELTDLSDSIRASDIREVALPLPPFPTPVSPAVANSGA